MNTMIYHYLQKFTDTNFRFDEDEPTYKNDLDYVDKKSKGLKNSLVENFEKYYKLRDEYINSENKDDKLLEQIYYVKKSIITDYKKINQLEKLKFCLMVIYGSSIDEIYNRIKDLPVSNFLNEIKREFEEEKELDKFIIESEELYGEEKENDSENQTDNENVISIIRRSEDPNKPIEKIDISFEELLDELLYELNEETLNYIRNHVEEILKDNFYEYIDENNDDE